MANHADGFGTRSPTSIGRDLLGELVERTEKIVRELFEPSGKGDVIVPLVKQVAASGITIRKAFSSSFDSHELENALAKFTGAAEQYCGEGGSTTANRASLGSAALQLSATASLAVGMYNAQTTLVYRGNVTDASGRRDSSSPAPEGTDKASDVKVDESTHNVLASCPDPAFDDIVDLVRQVTGFSAGALMFVDNAGVWMKSTNAQLTPTSLGLVEPHTVMKVPDLRQDSRFSDHPIYSKWGAYYGVPLVTRDRQGIGQLYVLAEKPAELGDQQVALMKCIAGLAIRQLELRRANVSLRISAVEKEAECVLAAMESEALRAAHGREVEPTELCLEVKETLRHVRTTFADVIPPADVARLEKAEEAVSSRALYHRRISDRLNDVAKLSQSPSILGDLAASIAPTARARSVPGSENGNSNGAAAAPSINMEVEVASVSSPDVEAVLKGVDAWDFNVFELQRVTGGRPLFHLAFYLINTRHGITAKLGLDPVKLARFLHHIESGYMNANPYHTATHAADMLQTVHHFLINGTVELMNLSAVEQLGILLAAALHDYRHPGVNNKFLAVTKHPIAIRYNDSAVLENFHCAEAFLVLSDPKHDFLSQLPEADQQQLRDIIISTVIATDMAQHGVICADFKSKCSGKLSVDDEADKILIFKMLIKGADISNVSKPFSLYSQWCERVMEEFYQQGDRERELGLPLSPFMDRETTVIAKCQIGFMNFVVLPLFEQLDECMAKLNNDAWVSHCDCIRENLAHWQSQCS